MIFLKDFESYPILSQIVNTRHRGDRYSLQWHYICIHIYYIHMYIDLLCRLLRRIFSSDSIVGGGSRRCAVRNVFTYSFLSASDQVARRTLMHYTPADTLKTRHAIGVEPPSPLRIRYLPRSRIDSRSSHAVASWTA